MFIRVSREVLSRVNSMQIKEWTRATIWLKDHLKMSLFTHSVCLSILPPLIAPLVFSSVATTTWRTSLAFLFGARMSSSAWSRCSPVWRWDWCVTRAACLGGVVVVMEVKLLLSHFCDKMFLLFVFFPLLQLLVFIADFVFPSRRFSPQDYHQSEFPWRQIPFFFF